MKAGFMNKQAFGENFEIVKRGKVDFIGEVRPSLVM